MVNIGGRLSAIIPIVASAVAVGLTISLLVSGTSSNTANDHYWMSVNTSKIGSQAIEIQAANFTQPGRGAGMGPGGMGPGGIGPPFGGLPGVPTGVFPAPPNPVSVAGGLASAAAGGLAGIFGGIVTDLTNKFGEGLEDLESQLLGNLTESLGVKDIYYLYVSKMCEGKFDNPNDPDTKITVLDCYSYGDKDHGLRNITKSIPGSFVVATANVSIPLITSLKGVISQVSDLAAGGATAMLVALILSTVGLGVVLLTSLAIFVLGPLRLLVIISVIFSMLGASVELVTAAFITGISVGGKSLLSDGAFSIRIEDSGSFLAMIWVAAVLAMASATYWFTVWFVNHRKTSFRRRKRTENQIGNWRGILSELKDDFTGRDGGKKELM